MFSNDVRSDRVPLVEGVLAGVEMYLGGYFTSVNGHPRTFAAAISTSGSGAVVPFAPQIDRPVSALARLGGHLCFGGIFLWVDGRGHDGIARDLWDPKLSSDRFYTGWDNRLRALDGRDGTLAVGSAFAGTYAAAAASFAVFGPAG